MTSFESEQQSKQKFIALMRNLVEHINENPAHRLTIYECLNTQQIKRLFQSLHDHSKTLRLTAMIFITKLLQDSPQIVDTLLMRDNCDIIARKQSPNGSVIPIHKFLITGLQSFNFDPQTLAQIVIIINTKVKYRANTLFWYIIIENKSFGYINSDSSLQDIQIDPSTHVIGIFVGDQQTVRQIPKTISNTQSMTMIRKNYSDQTKQKYSISKPGIFSINRRN